MTDSTTKIKYSIIAFIVLIIGIVGYFTFQTIDRSGKVKVTVLTVPTDAKIIIDTKTVTNGDVYIKPGKTKVSIEKSGFTPQSETITFAKPNGSIDIALTPESEEAIAWAEKNNALYTQYEGRAGDRATAVAQKEITVNPIIAKLPFKNLLFTIGYFVDQSDTSGNSIFVTIDAPEGYRQSAINKIKEWGFNPAELNIKIIKYENQFAL